MLAIRPGTDEYGAFYAGYIARVADGAMAHAARSAAGRIPRGACRVWTRSAPAAPMAPGKWSLLQVLSHVSDTERVFGFRMLWFARGEASELPGFDQDAWVAAVSAAAAHARGTARRIRERACGNAGAAAVRSLMTSPIAAALANGNPMTVRALRVDDCRPRPAPPRWAARDAAGRSSLKFQSFRSAAFHRHLRASKRGGAYELLKS